MSVQVRGGLAARISLSHSGSEPRRDRSVPAGCVMVYASRYPGRASTMHHIEIRLPESFQIALRAQFGA